MKNNEYIQVLQLLVPFALGFGFAYFLQWLDRRRAKRNKKDVDDLMKIIKACSISHRNRP